jgi:hypothetical protein
MSALQYTNIFGKIFPGRQGVVHENHAQFESESRSESESVRLRSLLAQHLTQSKHNLQTEFRTGPLSLIRHNWFSEKLAD